MGELITNNPLAAVAALAAIAAAIAATVAVLVSRQARQAVLDYLDTDRDGRVELEELRAHARRLRELAEELAGRASVVFLLALPLGACGGALEAFYLELDGDAVATAGYGENIAPAIAETDGRARIEWTPGTWPPVVEALEGCVRFAWLSYQVEECANGAGELTVAE